MAEQGTENKKDEGTGKPEDVNTQLVALLTKLDQKIDTLVPKEPVKPKEGEGLTAEELLKEFERVTTDEEEPSKGGDKKLSKQDIDNMSNSELLNLLVTEVINPNNEKLVERLEMIRVKDELRECKREFGEEFTKVQDKVLKLAMRNTNLSLEDAFFQISGREGAKSKRESGEDKGEGKEDSTEKGAKKPVAGGEKPGVSKASIQQGEPKTRVEAATRAVEEAFAKET